MQQDVPKKTRRIQQVSVTNLFGIFNHTLPLKMHDHITIIHGSNGFGKTMMLKLLHALFSQSNHLFRNIPFDEFRVEFEDNTSFWVSKTSRSDEVAEEEYPIEREIVFHASERKAYTSRSRSLRKEDAPIQLSMIERLMLERSIPSLDRIGSEAWRDIITGEILSLDIRPRRWRVTALEII